MNIRTTGPVRRAYTKNQRERHTQYRHPATTPIFSELKIQNIKHRSIVYLHEKNQRIGKYKTTKANE